SAENAARGGERGESNDVRGCRSGEKDGRGARIVVSHALQDIRALDSTKVHRLRNCSRDLWRVTDGFANCCALAGGECGKIADQRRAPTCASRALALRRAAAPFPVGTLASAPLCIHRNPSDPK